MCNITKTNTASHILRVFSLIMLFGSFVFNAMAGQTGEIRGYIKDDKGEGIPGVTVKAMAGGNMMGGVTTDITGLYSIKNLEAGKYDLEITSLSHASKNISGIAVSANKTSYYNVTLKEAGSTVLGETVIETVKAEKPVIEPTFSSIKTLDLDQIQNMAVSTGDITGMVVGISADVQPTNDGKGLYMRGSRANATGMIIDGEKIISGGNVPSTAIGGLLVLSGGVPAEYGDFTGGLVVITTKSYTQGIREKRVRNYEANEKRLEKEAMQKQGKTEGEGQQKVE